MRNKWKKPELVVLGRSRSEESVLAYCKTGGSEANAGTVHTGCATTNEYFMDCGKESDCYKCCQAPTT